MGRGDGARRIDHGWGARRALEAVGALVALALLGACGTGGAPDAGAGADSGAGADATATPGDAGADAPAQDGPTLDDASSPPPPGPLRVLVFSRTTGFRHASIEDGVALLERLAVDEGWTLAHTEDASMFADDVLARVDVTVWLSTTGDVLDDAQQAAFERFIAAGGGYVGVHSASDTEYDWPLYGEVVGAYFARHPAVQPATIVVEDHDHPATAHLGATWARTDEWYDFRTSPSGSVRVLLRLDESTYEGGGMGADHPIAWSHELEGGGRAFYTGLGHTSESYSEPDFAAHLAGAIRWAGRRDGAAP